MKSSEIRGLGIGGMGRRWDAYTGLCRETGRNNQVSDFYFCTSEPEDENVERVWQKVRPRREGR